MLGPTTVPWDTRSLRPRPDRGGVRRGGAGKAAWQCRALRATWQCQALYTDRRGRGRRGRAGGACSTPSWTTKPNRNLCRREPKRALSTLPFRPHLSTLRVPSVSALQHLQSSSMHTPKRHCAAVSFVFGSHLTVSLGVAHSSAKRLRSAPEPDGPSQNRRSAQCVLPFQ